MVRMIPGGVLLVFSCCCCFYPPEIGAISSRHRELTEYYILHQTKDGRGIWLRTTLELMLVIYVYMVTHIARVWINRVRWPILLVVSWTGKMNILHTQADSGAYNFRDSSRVPRRRPLIYFKLPYAIGPVPSYRVTQLRTDGVHCRESTGNRASKPQGSSRWVLPWQVTMD